LNESKSFSNPPNKKDHFYLKDGTGKRSFQICKNRGLKKVYSRTIVFKKDVSPLERSETDIVLPKRNSASETRQAKLELASLFKLNLPAD
jgi:hypothetical protein